MAISVDDGESDFVEFVADVAAWFDDELILWFVHETEEMHECGFATSYWTRQNDAFPEGYVPFVGVHFVVEKPCEQAENDFMVIGDDLEIGVVVFATECFELFEE